MESKKYDIFFLVESGIGNALEVLYAVEYSIKNGKKAGIFLNRISSSFTQYIRDCYGEEVVPFSLDSVSAVNLVHSFTFTDKIDIDFDNYYYVNADPISSYNMSETEQFLAIAKGLYPSKYDSTQLTFLKEDYSQRVKEIKPEDKIIMYPGCSSDFPVKRWPYFKQLVDKLGVKNVLLVGGNDDLDCSYSYYYPKVITAITPHVLLRRLSFYNMVKKLGVLKKHAHVDDIKDQSYSFFNFFNWGELVALFRRAKYFIGNDGGISHLAGVCGVKGKVIFGPSSVHKNKCYNTDLAPMATSYDCQPCQFRVNRRDRMAGTAILCPYQLRCLYNITPDNVIEAAFGDKVKEPVIAKAHV